MDYLSTLPGFGDTPGFDTAAWEGNLVIIEVAERQHNTYIPWYFRRMVEITREYGGGSSKITPWQFAIAGLPVLAEWLSVPECTDLANLIRETEPWQGGRGPRRRYEKEAQELITKIEHGVVRTIMNRPQSVDPRVSIQTLLQILLKWSPMFDRLPLTARFILPGKGPHKLGALFLNIFRHRPRNGG